MTTIPEEEVEAANGRWYYAQLQASPHEYAIWAAKEIAQLRQSLAAAKVRGAREKDIIRKLLPHVVNKDAGGCTGKFAETCPKCAVISEAIRALKETGHG